jgi:hypothetical protein
MQLLQKNNHAIMATMKKIPAIAALTWYKKAPITSGNNKTKKGRIDQRVPRKATPR